MITKNEKIKLTGIDAVLEETYLRLNIIDSELCKACIDNKYFVSSIEYYNADRVPINLNGERIDEPDVYVVIDTTRKIDEFESKLSFDSYSTLVLSRFMNYKDEEYVRC